ncbi:polymeric immunoglobulin receptor-like isoform X2 [Xiphophorus hellerii]|uniref:polymeric immunoglobulin receptor-like isoform X2 n=1 Tax=Xiphophorus hellerii TaxID=8084 RepID=UPI0013B40106|nr:polymeric immunoglobulin receptor-like isoform X2 [Xiphophorus hellerii]
MYSDRWIILLALWLTSASSSQGVCKKQRVSALLGSSVVLPCNFSSDDSSWVKWTQEDRPNVDVVRLSSKGRILYLDPRSGRVKTFPLQASERKYSIIIDDLQNSDIGSYYCRQSNECFEVKLSTGQGVCKTQKVGALLGSSVVLPCNFSSDDSSWVEWTQAKEDGQDVDLVHLSSKGRIHYLDPRSGRMKTFPLQASERNYSIVIDELQTSDIGSYYCEDRNECFEVEVKLSKYKGQGVCKKQKVSALLGSSVVLPCNFPSDDSSWVKWTQEDRLNVDLVRLSSKGRILYLDPRSGRVKTFPLQASERKYSIVIDDLQNSDIGSYYCRQSNECFEVKLSKDKGERSSKIYLLISICTGAAALILLSLLGYFCCLKCICLSNKNRTDGVIMTVSGTAGPSAPPHEGGVNGLPTGGNNLDNNLVYENDDQYLNPSRNPSGQSGAMQHGNQPNQSGIGIYPNLDEFKFQRAESQRTKQRFHIELFSRLRQASINRHFYANQGEIRRQQAMAAQAENNRAGMGRRKPKDSCEYKNPIYNRSTDQLNRL